MVPVGRLTVVRTFDRSELIRAMSFVAIPGLIGPMLGPLAGGLIVGYLHWRVIFFVNLPIGIVGLYMVLRRLPDFRVEHSDPLDIVGLILFGSGIALLSYVLEVFGETSLTTLEIVGLLTIAASLLFGYVSHARTEPRPLLHLGLFRLRTFACSIVGGFVTRLGSGGMPFLLPLLYQIGLGYSAVQSGLLIMPQPLAAMSLKLTMPKILARFGFRRVLLANTLLMGMLMMLFATVGLRTPVALIVAQAFAYGFVSSLQFTSMNTLVYSDVRDRETSQASTMASTGQQMALSFGVATASLAAALFIPDRTRASAAGMVHGTHEAFIVLGALTSLSSIVFFMLKPTDGANVSLHGDA
jgi:MFS family permease